MRSTKDSTLLLFFIPFLSFLSSVHFSLSTTVPHSTRCPSLASCRLAFPSCSLPDSFPPSLPPFSSFLHSYRPPWYLALIPCFAPSPPPIPPSLPPSLSPNLPSYLPPPLIFFTPPQSSFTPFHLSSSLHSTLCLLLYFPPYISLPSCSSPPLNVPL